MVHLNLSNYHNHCRVEELKIMNVKSAEIIQAVIGRRQFVDGPRDNELVHFGKALLFIFDAFPPLIVKV